MSIRNHRTARALIRNIIMEADTTIIGKVRNTTTLKAARKFKGADIRDLAIVNRGSISSIMQEAMISPWLCTTTIVTIKNKICSLLRQQWIAQLKRRR